MAFFVFLQHNESPMKLNAIQKLKMKKPSLTVQIGILRVDGDEQHRKLCTDT